MVITLVEILLHSRMNYDKIRHEQTNVLAPRTLKDLSQKIKLKKLNKLKIF